MRVFDSRCSLDHYDGDEEEEDGDGDHDYDDDDGALILRLPW